MPPETAAAQVGVEPKTVAGNIANGVQAKAAGKAPGGRGPEIPADGDEKKPAVGAADPNAGKRRFVVEGKERWLNAAEADAYVQKGLAFEPRVSELDRIKREMVQFEQTLLQDPGAIMASIARKTGTPIQTLVEKVLAGNASDEVKEATGKWYWENVASRQRMDPKDREILEKDERIKKLEAADKAQQDAAVATENRARVVKALGEVSAQIQETLKELGVTNTDSAAGIRITKEIADVMRISYLNRAPCTAKQAAEKVKARIYEYQKQFYDQLDTDQLVTALGKDNAEKVRKHFLKAVQEAEKGTQQESGRAAGQVPRRNDRKTMSMDDFHDYLDDLKRTGK